MPQKTPLKYPTQLEKDADRVQFTHEAYRPNRALKNRAVTGFNGVPSVDFQNQRPQDYSTINLYMPPSIPGMSQAGNYSSSGNKFLGPRLRSAANMANNMMSGFENGLFNDSTAPPGIQIRAGMIGSFFNSTPNEILGLTRGQIFNPNIELLYDGPQLRGFSFTFDMVPFNEVDTEIISAIVREFKMYSAPALNANDNFMDMPHIWHVKYSGKAAKYLNRFKPAMLEEVVVIDNGNNPYHSTFKDGAPVQTRVALKFTETQIVVRKDHEEVPGKYLRGY